MGLFGSVLGIGGALLGRSWAKSDSSKMRNWQEDMRSTAHQVEVEDLKRAGLNPVLSANAGAPMGQASAPVNPDVAGSASKGATAENIQAIADQNKVTAKFMKDKLKFYESNPEIKDIVQGARIAQDSGLPPSLGGTFGSKSIWDKISNYQRDRMKNNLPSTKPEFIVKPKKGDIFQKPSEVPSIKNYKF